MPGEYDIDRLAPDRDNKPDVAPLTPGWRYDENQPHPVDPNAAPGQAPRFPNIRPEK